MSNAGHGNSGLQIIFSFFLGLMLTAFIGVGVYTFHSPPELFENETRELSQRESTIRDLRAPGGLTADDRSEIAEINRQRNELNDMATEARMPWGRSTSIILIVFATIAMVVSLIRASQLPVISNGLLLGGVFSMLYGIGWIIATDTSITRFLVMTAALLITLGLGFVRFVRRGKSSQASIENTGLSDIERRVQDLEGRMSAAAQVLGRKSEGPDSL